VAEVVGQLRGDPALKGPKGDRGDTGPAGTPASVPQIDYERIVSEVTARLKVDEPSLPADAQWSHIVLVAPSSASYWLRLQQDFKAASEHYTGMRHMEPPEFSVGPIPALVAYSDGTPIKTWRGAREVSTALSQVARGDFDSFVFSRRLEDATRRASV